MITVEGLYAPAAMVYRAYRSEAMQACWTAQFTAMITPAVSLLQPPSDVLRDESSDFPDFAKIRLVRDSHQPKCGNNKSELPQHNHSPGKFPNKGGRRLNCAAGLTIYATAWKHIALRCVEANGPKNELLS